MTSPKPLKGIELVDCAKANAVQGIHVAAELCGYGQNISEFQQELKQACRYMGIEIAELKDLVTEQQLAREVGGIEIAPDSSSNL